MTKFSWNILHNYVDLSGMDTYEMADKIALQVLEVEEVNDEYIDIDVTPNRAHDCLAHIGIAREVATIIKRDFRGFEFADLKLPSVSNIEGSFNEGVRRFMTVKIDNVSVCGSPQWLQDRLAELGQKSINLVVDLTNYVMFEIGQPLHAYDRDKLPSNDLSVRFATNSDSVELLDEKKYELSSQNLIITDSNDIPLGLAGVKGGVSSQISDSTTSIILESANFHPTLVRKSAGILGLRTDALKRFENEPSPALCEIAVLRFCQLLLLEQPDARVELITDYYKEPVKTAEVVVNHSRLEDLLGMQLNSKDIIDICHRQSIAVNYIDGKYVLVAPYWRLDLKIVEDYVEEFGRIIGYEKIAEKLIEPQKTTISQYDLHTQIRNTLVNQGLFEVHTYSLVKKGDIKTLKPLASNKGALRKNISKQLTASLEMNAKNAELFNLDQVGIFEIGSIFSDAGEEKHLAIAVSGKQKVVNKKIAEIEHALDGLHPDLVNQWKPEVLSNGVVVEVSLANLTIDTAADIPESSQAKFIQFSNQPFTTRDISVWIMDGGSQDHLEQLIEDNAGINLLSYRMVDQFEKEDKKSMAYRLVFQHPEKTLTDSEVNQAMDNIYQALSSNYELR